jgi:hypothetical protein
MLHPIEDGGASQAATPVQLTAPAGPSVSTAGADASGTRYLSDSRYAARRAQDLNQNQ